MFDCVHEAPWTMDVDIERAGMKLSKAK